MTTTIPYIPRFPIAKSKREFTGSKAVHIESKAGFAVLTAALATRKLEHPPIEAGLRKLKIAWDNLMLQRGEVSPDFPKL